jgi:hypothetical protein
MEKLTIMGSRIFAIVLALGLLGAMPAWADCNKDDHSSCDQTTDHCRGACDNPQDYDRNPN